MLPGEYRSTVITIVLLAPVSVTQSVYQKNGTWKKATWKEARRGAWDKIHTHVVKSQGSRWCIYHLPLLGIHPANPLFQIIFVKNKDLLIISTIRSQRTGICHCVKDSTSHKESLSSWGRGKWLTNNVQEPTSAYSPGTIPFWFPSHFSVVSFKKFCKAC